MRSPQSLSLLRAKMDHQVEAKQFPLSESESLIIASICNRFSSRNPVFDLIIIFWLETQKKKKKKDQIVGDIGRERNKKNTQSTNIKINTELKFNSLVIFLESYWTVVSKLSIVQSKSETRSWFICLPTTITCHHQSHRRLLTLSATTLFGAHFLLLLSVVALLLPREAWVSILSFDRFSIIFATVEIEMKMDWKMTMAMAMVMTMTSYEKQFNQMCGASRLDAFWRLMLCSNTLHAVCRHFWTIWVAELNFYSNASWMNSVALQIQLSSSPKNRSKKIR